jgi:hypothetical protein
MKIRIIGKSVFMEFEHIAKNDKEANKFIKNVCSINRQLTLEQNPKPENARPRKTARWRSWAVREKTNPKLDAWREANKQYKLSIQIERVC